MDLDMTSKWTNAHKRLLRQRKLSTWDTHCHAED